MKKILILFLLFSLFNANADKTRAEIVRALFKSVENWMGAPYQYGGTEKDGVDCSAFTAHVYDTVFNIKLPRSVSEQKVLGVLVKDKLQPGDLLFFNTTGVVSHVGIYVFNNKFIHAASAGPEIGVIKSSLDEDYYKKRFVYAKRIIKLPPYVKEEIKEDIVEEKIKNEDVVNPKDEKENVKLVFGKILYHGKIFDESTNFSIDKPIFFQIIFESNQKKGLILDFVNLDNKLESKKYNFEIKNKTGYFNRIDLSKGNYKVKLYDNKNVFLFEKNIKIY